MIGGRDRLLRRGADRAGPGRPAHQLPAGHLLSLLPAGGRGHQAGGASRKPAERGRVPDPHPPHPRPRVLRHPMGQPGSTGSPSWRRATPPRPVWPSSDPPECSSSWITAAGAVLDTASLVVSMPRHRAEPPGADHDPLRLPGAARHRQFFHLPFEPDPAPDAPISIHREEFDALIGATARGRPAPQGRPGPGLAGLRRLAGQLRPAAAQPVRLGCGPAGAVVVGPHRTPGSTAPVRLGRINTSGPLG